MTVTTGKALVVPTSMAQQGLWLQDSIDPGRSAYNVTAVVRLLGPLDAAVLERALNTVADRHEVLRTVFDFRDGVPVQVISDRSALTVPVLEVTAEQADALIREEVRTPFDLRTGPLVRARVLRLGPGEHIVLLSVHHIVTDGESSAILVRELGQAYEAHLAGGDPEFDELPIQYADYAVWQRDTLRGEHRQRLVDFWTGRLSGASALALPVDRLRTGARTSQGATHRFTIPGATMRRLDEVAREQQVTPYMALVAGFDALLSRYCGQDDITVTSPMSGRIRPELDGLIGYFVNSVLLRTDLSGDPTFRELLLRVRTTCVDAINHQELPYEQVIELLRQGTPGAERLQGQVAILLLPGRPAQWRFADLVCELLPVSVDTAKSDLYLEVRPGDDYGAMLEYTTDLFNADTVEQFAAHLVAVLGAAAGGPDQRLSELLDAAVPAAEVPAAAVAPTFATPAGAAGYVAPRTPFEEEIAAMWADALGRERIGVFDNFFDVGGHSLIAVRLAAEIRDMFGVELEILDFYTDFTVAAVAYQVLERMTAEDGGEEAGPAEPAS
jgi:acyl carrier protein